MAAVAIVPAVLLAAEVVAVTCSYTFLATQSTLHLLTHTTTLWRRDYYKCPFYNSAYNIWNYFSFNWCQSCLCWFQQHLIKTEVLSSRFPRPHSRQPKPQSRCLLVGASDGKDTRYVMWNHFISIEVSFLTKSKSGGMVLPSDDCILLSGWLEWWKEKKQMRGCPSPPPWLRQSSHLLGARKSSVLDFLRQPTFARDIFFTFNELRSL